MTDPTMRNIKLLIEYDGTEYCGWQRQENGRTIQNEIETVLRQILQVSVTVIGAGRTDAGVHARGQVAHFHTDSPMPPNDIKRGLNGLLPADIVVLDVEEVAESFHARHSAKARTYSYTISRSPAALLRNIVWYQTYPLKLDLMNCAAEAIVGTHDFSSYCKNEADFDRHDCTVTGASWRAHEPLFIFTITANRFLHGMVRALVGTMVDVGRGYSSVHDVRDILDRYDRAAAGMSAPARGLALEMVEY